MKRMLCCILALALLLTLGACRRTDALDAALDATPAVPTAEPSMVPLYATALPQTSASPIQTDAPASVPDAATPDATIPDAAPAETQTPAPTETLSPTAAPSIADTYGYASISNEKLKVKFAYPETWTSCPGTDTICFQESVEEGGFPAQISVSSFRYTEEKVSTRRLKNHLQDVLTGIVAEYNEYQLGSVDSASFVGSAGLSATYLAVKGENYVSGYVVVGYAKNNRVYMMHFCCEQSQYETFEPLIAKLAENITTLS